MQNYLLTGWNWIRSSFFNSYKEPSIVEIKEFLQSKYTAPNNKPSAVPVYLKALDIYQMVYNQFNIKPDMLTDVQKKFLKDKIHVAMNYLEFPVVNRKISHNHSEKRIMVVKL